MAGLKEDWLTDGLVDFEHKKYTLLAYAQEVAKRFDERKLYPIMGDLIFHYNNLLSFKKNKQIIYKNFPQHISKADLQKLKLTYKRVVEEDDLMQEIEDIVLFAMPRFKNLLANGKNLYEMIEQKLEIETLGIVPVQPYEGYVLINEYKQSETQVHSYRVTLFESPEEKYRGISTTFLESIQKGIGQTYENMKVEIIKRHKDLPNPAVFLINSMIPCRFKKRSCL